MRKLIALLALLAAAPASATLLTTFNLNLIGGSTGSGNRGAGGSIIMPSVTVATTDVDVAEGAATAAVVTYTAVNGRHAISGVAWSYSAAPTGGSLIIADGAGTVFSIAITAAGPGYIPFTPVLRGTTNTALVVTLASGAGAVVGKVNVMGHWIEYP